MSVQTTIDHLKIIYKKQIREMSDSYNELLISNSVLDMPNHEIVYINTVIRHLDTLNIIVNK